MRNSTGGPTRLEQTAHARLFTLVGSPYEQGFQLGEACRDKDTRSALDYYASFVERALHFQIRSSGDEMVRRILFGWVRCSLIPSYVRQIPRFYREMMEGFSLGSGFPLDQIESAFVMPDVYTFLLGLQNRWKNNASIPPMAMGCSAFVHAGSESKGVPFLHARNLDFPGGQAWYSQPMVAEFRVEGGLSYATLSSMGIFTAGITSTNEAGISLSLNMNYSKVTRTGTTPIVIVGHEIIRRCRTLQEAVEILKEVEVGSGWTFVISSVKEKESFTAELSPQGLSIHPMQKHHQVRTNHYQDKTYQDEEYWITKGRWLDTRSRAARLENLLSKNLETLDVQKAISFLGDDFDEGLKKSRSYGSTLCQVHTLLSAVFEPKESKIHLAVGRPPVSRSTFESIALFPGPVSLGFVQGSAKANSLDEARFHYALATEAYFPFGDFVSAKNHLSRAIEIYPEEELFWFMLGLLDIKLEDYEESLTSLEKALSLDQSEYRRAQNHLFQGHVLDLLRKHDVAREQYHKAKDDAALSKRAVRYLKRAYRDQDAKSLFLDFMLGDGVDPRF